MQSSAQLPIICCFISIYACIVQNTFQAGINSQACTEEYCKTYRDTVKCPELSRPCRAQNSTSNGMIFISPTQCNCCEICVENLGLGADCSKGSPGLPVPTAICGPELYCTESPGKAPTCQKMSSSSVCHSAQKKFDDEMKKGTIGSLQQRPRCDGDGNFMPTICIDGQNCFCVDKLGQRIFGDGLSRGNIDVQMKCECSRLNEKLSGIVKSKLQHFSLRCSEDGSFDTLQCFDELCLCVDRHSGSPTSDTRNISAGLADLPCFDKKIHSNTTYLRECESIKMGIIRSFKDFAEQGKELQDYLNNICDLDGFYAPIKEKNNAKFCSDKNGQLIESFQVKKGTTSAINMNCKCARARMLLRANGYLEFPECCPNGNYRRMACRRGQCYCVDENGLQSSLQVPEKLANTLECYKDLCDEDL